MSRYRLLLEVFYFIAYKTLQEMERKCLECGEILHGRIDKKFCSDACRNAYNNKQRNSSELRLMRKINKILARNRNIMAILNSGTRKPIHRSVMSMKGFDFSYFTCRRVTRSGKVCYYCYDQGYMNLGNNFVMLVRRQEMEQGD